MLDNLKQKLTNNTSIQYILADLTDRAFVNSLSNTNIQQLIKIVQSKQGNYKIHPKVITAIYGIIIMKGANGYNSKLAIQQLLAASQDDAKIQQDHTKKQDKIILPNKTRQVIANLLLRIPTFSNYKLIIKDIIPELLPFSILQQHKNNMIKQCPNLYKDYLMKQYKHIWYRLVQNDQLNYPLFADLGQIYSKMCEIVEKDKVLNVEIIYQNVEKNLQFIRNRIIHVQKQQLDIQKICKQFNEILTFNIAANPQKKILLPQLINRQYRHIRNIKTSCIELLRLFIIKLKYSLFRKFCWLTGLIEVLITRPYDQCSIQPAYLIALCTSLLEQYGLGFYNFDQLVHSNDGPYSFDLLISSLCYNDYKMNNKQQQVLINYQAPKNQNQNKKNNTIRINLYNTSVINSAYEFYLKKTNAYHRQFLLQKILLFLKKYYLAKNESALQPFYSSQIFGIFGSSKNQLSEKIKRFIIQIKEKILFKDFKRIGDHFQQFCDGVFNTYIKKRKQKKFQILTCLQVQIQPSLTKVKPLVESSKSLLELRKNNQSDGNQLKKTHSFDLNLQGWNTQRKYKQDQQKGEKSQIFYSIKQSSIIQQNDQNNKQNQQQNQPEFILTPQF